MRLIELLTISKVQALEVEFFRSWIGQTNVPEYQEKERHLLQLADGLGVRHINVGVFELHPVESVIRSLRDLARRSAPYNLIVQLEFMPYTPPVNSLRAAWDIVSIVDKPNVGLLVDVWHWARSDNSRHVFAQIPPERITLIQLSDLLPESMPNIRQESLHHRQVPGKGAFDIVNFYS